jgi:hypothetical protein
MMVDRDRGRLSRPGNSIAKRLDDAQCSARSIAVGKGRPSHARHIREGALTGCRAKLASKALAAGGEDGSGAIPGGYPKARHRALGGALALYRIMMLLLVLQQLHVHKVHGGARQEESSAWSFASEYESERERESSGRSRHMVGAILPRRP